VGVGKFLSSAAADHRAFQKGHASWHLSVIGKGNARKTKSFTLLGERLSGTCSIKTR
jgi:hypothetical protein